MSNFLVVDDNEGNLYMLRSLLEGYGHCVDTAADGIEALARARDTLPDMIISDIMMPRMDGFRLCKEVKTDPGLHKIPFIFYTATFTDDKNVKLGLNLGASRYIIKPMEVEKFIKIVNEVLSDYSTHRLHVPIAPAKEQQELLRMYEESISSKLEEKVEELQQTNAQLIQEIIKKELAEEEREHLLKALALKNKELESIMYISSHDLRTPIVNVLGYSGELKEGCEQLKAVLDEAKIEAETRQKILSILNDDILMPLDFICSSTVAIDNLQNGLLKVCRLGRETLDIKTVDMNGLVAKVIENIQYQIDESGARVTVSELPPCQADEGKLSQVFMNLLDNAIKYRDPTRPGQINVSGKIKKEKSVYCIEDNGIGIAPGSQEKVFEIFHQLNPKSPAKGEGLGLTIVHRIVERQDGKVRLESESGKGSRFFVELPRSMNKNG